MSDHGLIQLFADLYNGRKDVWGVLPENQTRVMLL